MARGWSIITGSPVRRPQTRGRCRPWPADTADELARRLGISRSELYARALARELAAESDTLVTSRLDEVFADADSSLDAPVSTAQRRVLESSEW